MADNTVINATTTAGGVTFRDVDKAGLKTQVVTLDLGGAGAEALMTGTLPVSAASLPLPSGAATEATVAGVRTDLGTDGTTPPVVLGLGTGVRGWLRSIYEKLTGTLAVTGTFWQATQPVSLAVAPVTPITDNAGSLTVDAPVGTPAFVRLSDGVAAIATLPVSAASLPLPTGAATETTLAALNTKVTAVNTGAVVLAAGTAVVGSISNTAFTANAGTNLNTSALALDATLTGGAQKAINRSGVKGTALAADITSNPVDVNTEALHVNLVGVNPVNATLTAETTKVIGTVNIAALQTVGLVAGTANIGDVDVLTLPPLVAGTAIIGALVANQSENVSQINGVVPLMGNGITGTGSLRVTVASDNTAFAVNSTLTAETTKVIGTINIAGAQTVGLVAGTANIGDVDVLTLPPLVAGTANIGDVDVLTLPALVAGTAVIGALVANQSVNVAQIAGTATAAGTGVVGAGVQRMVLATDVVLPAQSEQRAAVLSISVTAAVNTALTASLPAPAAGLFHYITAIELVKLYAVLGVAAAAGVIVTTTNFRSVAYTTEQAAGPLGTAPRVISFVANTPIRCDAAATATTFVAPAQTQTIWRWNISYFTAV